MGEYPKEHSREEQRSRTFVPQDHLIQLKSRNGSADYLPVQWRLVWFREECPHGTIETEELEVDLDREMEEETLAWNNETHSNEKIVKRAKGYARYKAIVTDGKGGKATGTKTEKAVSFPDFVEKAETGAIGRALAALGYGTQFTGDEFDEQHRIVDAPVDRSPASVKRIESNGSQAAPARLTKVAEKRVSYGNSTQAQPGQLITDSQVTSARKLYERLGRTEPENLRTISNAEAKELITQLSQEYRQSRSEAS